MDSPHSRLLHLGTEQQVGEEEDVPNLPGAFRHLHQKAILHQLTGLRENNTMLIRSNRLRSSCIVGVWF